MLPAWFDPGTGTVTLTGELDTHSSIGLDEWLQALRLSPERWCASRRLGRFLVNLKADSMCIVQLDTELTYILTGCLVGV